MKQIDKYYLNSGYVPVYQPPGNPMPCILDKDLPDDLAEAFGRASAGSTCPAPGAGYLHDLESFLASGDPMAQKYTGRIVWIEVDSLKYANLTVPVMKVVDPDRYRMHSGPIVRREDLPEDLAKAFFEGWQMLAACPGQGMSYLHDFEGFMDRSGRGWSGDFSEVVGKYR